MRQALVLVLGFIVGMIVPRVALAGPYGEEMTKCLVRSISAADRTSLSKWLFATMALTPEIEVTLTQDLVPI